MYQAPTAVVQLIESRHGVSHLRVIHMTSEEGGTCQNFGMDAQRKGKNLTKKDGTNFKSGGKNTKIPQNMNKIWLHSWKYAIPELWCKVNPLFSDELRCLCVIMDISIMMIIIINNN